MSSMTSPPSRRPPLNGSRRGHRCSPKWAIVFRLASCTMLLEHVMLDVLRKKPATPEHVLHRSYQNALRAIGRYADAEKYRAATLFEVQNGFILRAFSAADPSQVLAIEIPDEDVQELVVKNYAERGRRDGGGGRPTLLPSGYEDFFRALGSYLDSRNARSVSVVEMVDAVAVSFLDLRSTNDAYLWQPQSFVIGADQIQKLLKEASDRRTSKR